MNFNFSASLKLCLEDSSILRLQPALPPLPSFWASRAGLDTHEGNIHTCLSSQHSQLLSLGLGVHTPATRAVRWRSLAGPESGLGADWTGGLGSARSKPVNPHWRHVPKAESQATLVPGLWRQHEERGGGGGARRRENRESLEFGVGIPANRSSATCLL